MGLGRHFFIMTILGNIGKVLLKKFSDNNSMGLAGKYSSRRRGNEK